MFARVAAVAVVALFLAGCHRTLRETKLEGAVDTGVLLDFGELDGRELKWDFADGSPRAGARQARHAFARAGRYVVQGFDGDFLAERVELIVVPRPVARAVPEDTDALVWVPSLKEDLGLTVDFFERVAGPGNVQHALEATFLPALAVELSSGDGTVVDTQEGVGVLMLPGFDGTLALLGVVDGERALQALATRLIGSGADEEPKSAEGVRTFSAAWGTAAAFVDRGYLYLVQPEPGVTVEEVAKVVARVRTAGVRGLQAYPPFTESLAGIENGNLFFYAREDRPVEQGAREPLLRSVVAGLGVGLGSATLHGRVRTSRPMSTPVTPSAMFGRAAESPVAALKLSFSPDELAGFVSASASEGKKPGLVRRLEAAGVDVDAALRALTGEVGVLAWFDAEGFLKNLVTGSGKPEWRGVVHLIAGLTRREPVEPALRELLGEAVRAPYADDRDALLWQERFSTATATIALTPKALMIRSGEGSGPRANADLEKQFGERFKGAFGPGHSSLLLDLGRLKTELDVPRTIAGLDATRVVTVQGFASAFLDQLTPIDHLVLDFAPDGSGGKLWGMISLKLK